MKLRGKIYSNFEGSWSYLRNTNPSTTVRGRDKRIPYYYNGQLLNGFFDSSNPICIIRRFFPRPLLAPSVPTTHSQPLRR